MLKHCPGCNSDLEATESNFHKNRSRKDGWQVQCKQCAKRYTDTCRANTDPLRMRQYGNKFKLLAIIKEQCGCYFCGNTIPLECIEFHHRDSKQKESSITHGTKIVNLCAELEKCVTVCCNCHTMIHRGTRQCPEHTNIDIELCKRLLSQSINYTKPKNNQLKFDFSPIPEGMQVTTIKLDKDGNTTTVVRPYHKDQPKFAT